MEAELPGTAFLREALASGWLHTVAVSDGLLVTALRHELSAGEAEAIALAAESGAARVLIDEADGMNCQLRRAESPA